MRNVIKVNVEVFEEPPSLLSHISIATGALNIAGGTLMVIGSFSPWVYGRAADYIFFLNGFELGSRRGFSVAGLLPVIFGALGILISAMQLANRYVPRICNWSSIANGVVGVGIGLYGLGWASWYRHQLTQGYSSLFASGVKYGVWLVLIGGSLAMIGGALRLAVTRPRSHVAATIAALIVVISLGAIALAPK